jgi:hypothetical protein
LADGRNGAINACTIDIEVRDKSKAVQTRHVDALLL